MLRHNVFKEEILFFLRIPFALSMFLILIVFLTDLTANGAIFLYFICTILWSLLFPKIACELPSKAVDFWYYTFSSIGVVVFFFAQTADREHDAIVFQHFVNSEASSAGNYIASGVVDLIPQVDSLSELTAFIKQEADALYTARKMSDAMHCQHSVSPRLHGETNNWVALISASYSVHRLCKDPDFGVVLDFLRAGDFSNPSQEVLRAAENTLWPTYTGPLSDTLLVIADAKKTEGGASALRQILAPIEQLSEAKVEASAVLQNQQSEIQNLRNKTNGGQRPLSLQLLHLVWPFFLLAAISLKIARVDYVSKHLQ